MKTTFFEEYDRITQERKIIMEYIVLFLLAEAVNVP